MANDDRTPSPEKAMGRGARLRVVDAVVGGGLNLRAGQIVSEEDLGEFARSLIETGALERLGDDIHLL